jgi:hypothetical protein
MNPVLIRRKAHCALGMALRDAGIPADFVILPHMDDERLLPAAEDLVHWMTDDLQSLARIWFYPDGLSGAVEGDNVYRLSDSASFCPEDYGIGREFYFPFDISDIADIEAWSTLPMVKLPKRRRMVTSYKAKGALS